MRPGPGGLQRSPDRRSGRVLPPRRGSSGLVEKARRRGVEKNDSSPRLLDSSTRWRSAMTRRTQQMSEFLREEVVDIIRSEIDDPRLGFWTVTRVEVLPDLRSARIYVSVLGTDGERKETIAA